MEDNHDNFLITLQLTLFDSLLSSREKLQPKIAQKFLSDGQKTYTQIYGHVHHSLAITRQNMNNFELNKLH